MNTKNPLLFVVVGFVLVGFGFYHFALGPKQKEASSLNAKISKAQSELDSARALLATNTAAQKSYQESYAKVVRLGKAVPGDDDVRSLVVQLDHAAKSTHVDFQAIDVGDAAGITASTSSVPTGAGASLPPGVTVGPAGFPIMPFSFTFKGGFFRLGEFFRRLNAFVKTANDKVAVTGRLLTVGGVKLEPDASGFPNIQATVSATSYLVSPLEGATGGATPAGPAGASGSGGSAYSGASGASSSPPTTTATGVVR